MALFLRTLLVALALISSKAASAQEAVAPLYLAEAIEEALAHSHDISAAQHNIRAAEARLSEATISPFFQFRLEGGAAWVPNATGVQGYSSDSRNQLDRAFGPALEGKIRGAVPLWTFGKLSSAREAATAGVEAARGGLERIRQQLTFDVRRAYIGLQLALDTQQMISEGLPKLENARDAFRAKLSADTGEDIDPVDSYRLDSAVLEVRARKSEATRLEQSARSALALLTGREHLQISQCPLEPIQVSLDQVSSYVDKALGRKPEISMLAAANRAKNAQASEKSARFLPDLALALEAEARYVPGRTAFEHYLPYYLGAAVVARWNLDFWGHHKRSERVQHEQRALSEQTKHAHTGLALNVQTHYAAVVDAKQRVVTWGESHKIARRWFVSAAQGYQVGTTSPKELIDGVKAYFKARFSHLQSIHDLNSAVAALEFASGSPVIDAAQWPRDCPF